MGVITYISGVYPGLISDKTIVQQSGLLNLLTVEDLVLADKGFLIQDLVPDGVSVNISPFLINGAFTESEARATKAIAKCRIHVKRENAEHKDFKILRSSPSYIYTVMQTLYFSGNCKMEKKILGNFQSLPLFFHLFPHATALTCEMSYSPERRLIRDGVEPKLITVNRPMLAQLSPEPKQLGDLPVSTLEELIFPKNFSLYQLLLSN